MIDHKGDNKQSILGIDEINSHQAFNIISLQWLMALCLSMLLIYPAYGQVDTFVANINAGGSSNPGPYTIVGSMMFFPADDGLIGNEILYFDCVMQNGGDINVNTYAMGSSDPEDLTVLDDKIFFSATDGDDGRELWWYDIGTSTLNNEDIFPGALSSFPSEFTPIGDKMFFRAQSGLGEEELWWYDCGLDNLFTVNIDPVGESSPQQLRALGDKLFFSAGTAVSPSVNDGLNGYDLSTGTPTFFHIPNSGNYTNTHLELGVDG